MNSWRIMVHRNLPGARQMAIDETLFAFADPDQSPVLRFYTWEKPTLSLGYFQDYKMVVSPDFIRHNNIDVVRRITGGRAVLHQHEVTYAVAGSLTGCFANQSLRETYRLIARALNKGLQHLGIRNTEISRESSGSLPLRESKPQCFVAVSPYEISKDIRKIIGSAQKRSRDRFLQHGSILLDYDAVLQNGCVLHPDPQLEGKVAPIQRILNRVVTMEELVSRMHQGFEEELGVRVVQSTLNDSEQTMVATLEEKYRSQDWTQLRCR